MKLKSECCEVSKSSMISRTENKMTFRVKNDGRHEVTVCRVDGCMLGEGSKKCDYLFVVGNIVAYLVELKGQDRRRALLQLVEAAEDLAVGELNVPVKTCIVTSKTPRADTKYQKDVLRLKTRFKKAGAAAPIQKNNLAEVSH